MRWPINRVASLGFCALGLVVIAESLRLSLNGFRDPGPGFVPFFLGLALVLLSAASFFHPDGKSFAEAFRDDPGAGRVVPFTFAALIGYLALLETLGFLLDTVLLLYCLVKLAGEPNSRRAATISIAAVLVVHVLFVRLLQIPFPRGVFGV